MYIYVEIRLLVGTKFRIVVIVNFSLKIFILFKFVCVSVCCVCVHARKCEGLYIGVHMPAGAGGDELPRSWSDRLL